MFFFFNRDNILYIYIITIDCIPHVFTALFAVLHCLWASHKCTAMPCWSVTWAFTASSRATAQ